MDELYPVVIAGAGPVGLALARALAEYGVRSLVVEQKPHLSEHSKALLIVPRTLEILRGWGELERFTNCGFFVPQLNLNLVGYSEPAATFDLSRLRRISPLGGAVILPQNRTEELLLDAVQQRGQTEVCFGEELTGFTDEGERVVVRTRRADGTEREIPTRFLIGCDGPHSTVRGQLGWHLEGKTYDSRLMLADVHLTDARDELPWPRAYPLERGALFAIRIEEHLWRIIASLEPHERDEAAQSEESIRRKVELLFGPGPYENVWASVFSIHCRTSPFFRRGRVVLAGDAAHINSPAGGQGMNAGIQDAGNLAWKLAYTLEGGSVERLLTSYQQERRGAALNNIDRFTDFLTRLALFPVPLLRTGMLRTAQAAVRLPTVQERLLPRLGMLDITYGESALLTGRMNRVGQRAIDGDLVSPTGETRRLYDAIGRDPLLILFDDGRVPSWDAAQVEAGLAELPRMTVMRLASASAPVADGAYRDASGALWNAWNATGDLTTLIRPDGYVGWAARRPSLAELHTAVAAALGFGSG